MSRIEDLKESIEKDNEILKEMEEFNKEISEVEKVIEETEKAKEVLLELEKKTFLELESISEVLSDSTYMRVFGDFGKGTIKKNKTCSKESINFQTVKRLLEGETLFAIAADIYADKTDKTGKNRVVDGKADFETVYLTGRHIEDFFKKCPEYGRLTKGLSKKNGKIYAPVIELSEVGKEAFK